MSEREAPVTILTSAVGLGIYIPALLIARQLRTRGIAAEVDVLEGHYSERYRDAHAAHRDAHHASFALAQLAHRMARPVEHCLDAGSVAALLDRWNAEHRDRFIVWAGFWLPLLETYRAQRGPLRVDHCRIDAVVSASFRVHADLDRNGRGVWLWNGAQRRIEHEIRVSDLSCVDFAEREQRVLVHGGGWGIGTYRDAAPELNRAGYGVDLVVHDAAEAPSDDRTRVFMLDPDWHAWTRGGGDAGFPAMLDITHGHRRRLVDAGHHAMHDVARASKAIVSKPGGCTLIDSLAAATPVVLLEPYGYAEAANAVIWEALGFGIPYGTWRDSGYDPAILERLHRNILARRPAIDYVEDYARSLVAENA